MATDRSFFWCCLKCVFYCQWGFKYDVVDICLQKVRSEHQMSEPSIISFLWCRPVYEVVFFLASVLHCCNTSIFSAEFARNCLNLWISFKVSGERKKWKISKVNVHAFLSENFLFAKHDRQTKKRKEKRKKRKKRKEGKKERKKERKKEGISLAYHNGFYCVFWFCAEYVVKNLSENISLGCKYVTVNIEIKYGLLWTVLTCVCSWLCLCTEL